MKLANNGNGYLRGQSLAADLKTTANCLSEIKRSKNTQQPEAEFIISTGIILEFASLTNGVGKTLTARTIASIMFGDKDAFVKIDMSEYMETISVSR